MSGAAAPARLATLACAVAALFFLYGFVLRVSPGVMVEELMRDFGATALVLGNLSAFYFYPYAVLQIPLGVWMDRVGPRWTMTGACALVALGCWVFGSSESLTQAYAGRFLIGVGCALSWPGFLMVVHLWFPSRFAFLAGVGQLAGMAGGVIGQVPLAHAVSRFGWQPTVSALGLVGAGLCVALALSVRNRPVQAATRSSTRHALMTVLGNPKSWLAGCISGAMAVQVLTFGGLWGVPFVQASYGVERAGAAGVVSWMFAGLAVGAVLTGWWADRTAHRERPMIATVLLCTTAACSVIYLPNLPHPLLSAAVFAWGLGTGGIVLGFAVCRALNPPGASGLAVGFVNTFVIGGGAVLQLLIGWLLDLSWSGEVAGGIRVYVAGDFRLALSTLPAVLALSALCIAGLRGGATWHAEATSPTAETRREGND